MDAVFLDDDTFIIDDVGRPTIPPDDDFPFTSLQTENNISLVIDLTGSSPSGTDRSHPITIDSDNDNDDNLQVISDTPASRVRVDVPNQGRALWNLFNSRRNSESIPGRRIVGGPIRSQPRSRINHSSGGRGGRGGIGTDSPDALRGLLSHVFYYRDQHHHHHHHHHHHNHLYSSFSGFHTPQLVQPKFKPPNPARNGFTRDITNDMSPPLCTKCARILGSINDINEKTNHETTTTTTTNNSIELTNNENTEKIRKTFKSNRVHALRCGHLFCGDCIDEIQSSKKCLLCNRKVNKPSDIIECFI